MAIISRAWRLIFPPRAQTQTWMFLTFALFVGMAVAGVGLYVLFILRIQVNEAAEATHTSEVEQIASIMDEGASDSERIRILQGVSRITDLHVLALRGDSLVWNSRPEGAEATAILMEEQTVSGLGGSGTYFTRDRLPNGNRVTITAISRTQSGLTLAVIQPELALHSVALDMQWTLFLGMIMALLMALIGSWIASDRVTRPLLAIGRSADNIAKGKFDTTIRVDTRSAEIQDLAANLDRMSVSYRQKIRELVRVTRIQSDFIGNVSHEVRNPIFVISGYLEALGSSKLTSAVRSHYAAKGLANLQRLSNLFNDLIEISRLEYREDLLKPSAFALSELVHEVTELLRPKAERKGVALVSDSVPLSVLADRNRIRQVLVNLMDNAVAYSDSGSVKCLYRLRHRKVHIEVIDSGQGISEEHLGRIFERFYRVDPARSRKSGGSGLGLSIAKQILHAHGEAIHVESTPGLGTRFWFALPTPNHV